MEKKSAKLFRNGRNQAVRLPRDFEFDGVDEVLIEKKGGKLVITPIRPGWVSFASLPRVGDDFMTERPEIFDPEGVKF